MRTASDSIEGIMSEVHSQSTDFERRGRRWDFHSPRKLHMLTLSKKIGLVMIHDTVIESKGGESPVDVCFLETYSSLVKSQVHSPKSKTKQTTSPTKRSAGRADRFDARTRALQREIVRDGGDQSLRGRPVQDRPDRHSPQGRLPAAKGYSGHVPGLVALNFHGATWLSLMQSVKGAQTVRHVDDVLSKSSTPRKSLPFGPREMNSNELGKKQESVKSSRPGSTTSRSSKRWSPPVAGYTGHVPGYVAGNMHGASWMVMGGEGD
eukprot:739939-Hanusia_phi.AAC.2